MAINAEYKVTWYINTYVQYHFMKNCLCISGVIRRRTKRVGRSKEEESPNLE